jgi:hypothetical protein
MGRDEGAMRASITAAVLLAVTLWSAPTVAEASFNKQAASAQSATSAMLHPPTNLVASARPNCSVTVTWTPTVDATATGYRLYNGATLLMPITPATSSSKVISIPKNTNYTLVMVTFYLNWTSSTIQAPTISC